MSSSKTTTILTYGLLAGAAGVAFLLPASLGPRHGIASPAPSQVDIAQLEGFIRDFTSSHPDFNTTASAGNGHYAGNIALGLGSDERPVFTANGSKVIMQWNDRNGHNIAPHMYMNIFGDPGKIPVSQLPSGPSHGLLDTYDSSIGPYGGTNQGPAPTHVIAPMPAVVIPWSVSGLTNQGDLTYAGTTTISSDIRCNTLTADGTINISGNISILCEQAFNLATGAVVNLLGDSRLTLYLPKGGSSWNHVEMNKNTGNPQRVIVYNMGTATWMIHNHAEVYATIIAPNGTMNLASHAELFGRYIGKTIYYDNHAGFHVDNAARIDSCGVSLNDTAGMYGSKSTAGINSASTFNHWFNDVLGVNLAAAHSLDLVLGSDGVYEYETNDFHPIDGRMFGNEGMAHNHFFTFTATTTFTHHACDARFFEFAGADDAWLFVDGRLVLDVGGVAPLTPQRITMDRLNLTDGQIYRLDFFYAQRQSAVSGFSIRTNLDLARRSIPYTMTTAVD